VTNIRTSRVFDDGAEGLEIVQRYRRHRRRNVDPIPPVAVQNGPALENVMEGSTIDVLRFPAPKWHEGRWRALHRHRVHRHHARPDSDWVNLGTYRVMVHDKNTLCVFISTATWRRHSSEILGSRPTLSDDRERRPVSGARCRRGIDAGPQVSEYALRAAGLAARSK